MKIRQELLSQGLRVILTNKDQINELSKELHKNGYRWKSGSTLIDLKYFDEKEKGIIYEIPKPPSKSIYKSSIKEANNNSRVFLYKYEEIKDDCPLYKEV